MIGIGPVTSGEVSREIDVSRKESDDSRFEIPVAHGALVDIVVDLLDFL